MTADDAAFRGMNQEGSTARTEAPASNPPKTILECVLRMEGSEDDVWATHDQLIYWIERKENDTERDIYIRREYAPDVEITRATARRVTATALPPQERPPLVLEEEDAHALLGLCFLCARVVQCHVLTSGTLAFFEDDGGDLVPHDCPQFPFSNKGKTPA